MAKHSAQGIVPTQVSYALRNARLRLSRFSLTVISGQEESRVFEFDDGPVRIGTLPDECAVTLRDELVSRRHCQIVRDGDTYLLQDLQSTNGTFVWGVRVREVYLTPGTEFTVGETRIQFAAVSEAVKITPTAQPRLGSAVGSSVQMREIFSVIEKLAHTDTTVVIEGETGTGKDVVARTIHETSRRAKRPFVVFDCSAVPEHLIESELFGHEKGSFTGAIMAREGLFELASGGTIFLDELGELSLDLQPKLLRVLENRQIRRVGSSRTTTIDVRVIAATNRRLDDEVREGRFREDLFYRLSVVRIFLPPLRERLMDIPLLVEHFLSTAPFNRGADGKQRALSLDPQVYDALSRHAWPGNVRELLNVLERACSFTSGPTITLDDLPPSLTRDRRGSGQPPHLSPIPPLAAAHLSHLSMPQERAPQPALSASAPPVVGAAGALGAAGEAGKGREEARGADVVREREPGAERPPFETFKDAKERWVSLFERDYVISVLKRNRYNISHAAREADIDRKYFRKLMQKYEIEVP
jgi:transcriptional regulator with GAF, ATPase, and Fis domain